MGEPRSPEAIAKWAEQQPANLHKGKGSALTHDQLQALVKLHKLERTQTEIAQAIGCDQSTVSRYLKDLTDTGDYAGAYLRSQQGALAEKFVEKAKGSDILDLLDRFGSIPAAKSTPPMQIAIGISLPGMPTVSVGATSASPLSPQGEDANG